MCVIFSPITNLNILSISVKRKKVQTYCLDFMSDYSISLVKTVMKNWSHGFNMYADDTHGMQV